MRSLRAQRIAADRRLCGAPGHFLVFAFGPMQNGLLELSSGEIRLISMGDEVRDINPQFSPDGRDLYPVADPLGSGGRPTPDSFRQRLDLHCGGW
jgi:hypothetical protein